jgi:flagellar biosynthesis/type III secretory pathway M-ring protein FliF/YscJ
MMITILSVWVMPIMFDITNNNDKINNLGLSSNFVKGVFFVVIPLVQIYFVAGVILWLVIFVSSAIINNRQEEAYHEDYMKIINEIIIKST